MKSAEAMASGDVEFVKKIKIIIFCALAVVVALLMDTQAEAMAGNRDVQLSYLLDTGQKNTAAPDVKWGTRGEML
jgi:hypothetical protein